MSSNLRRAFVRGDSVRLDFGRMEIRLHRRRCDGVAKPCSPTVCFEMQTDTELLDHQFRIIDGERHAGLKNEGYTRGLRFAFAPLAPERGPSTFPPDVIR